MTESTELQFEDKMRAGFGEPPEADFEAWLSNNRHTVAYLNPVVTAICVRRRRFLAQLVSGSLAAAIVLVATYWGLAPQKHTFAQTFETIKQAKTVSWTIDWYDRLLSVDGKRSWLRRSRKWERSYLAPNKWRDVRYDDEGNIASVEIEDTTSGEVLQLDMQKRTAMLRKEPSGQFGRGGPFGRIEDILKNEPIEYVGQRLVDGIKANVFRNLRETHDGRGENTQIWIDAESKRLIKFTTSPGSDYFDPETAPDQNNAAEGQFSKGTIAGVIHRDIKFDLQLDPSLFSLTPPTGFTIVDPPQRVAVTEEVMIQWLRLSAEANGRKFLELERGFNLKWHNSIENKPESERTESEREYLQVTFSHQLDGNMIVMEAFADSFTEANTFRYLGKGVELGSKERIVCYYKLKNSDRYRVVYGDLSVNDIDANDLPLPVE